MAERTNIAELVETKQRMITSTAENARCRRRLLLATGVALARIFVEHDDFVAVATGATANALAR